MSQTPKPAHPTPPSSPGPRRVYAEAPRAAPLLNYTLSTVCAACGAPTVRRACKVRCERCGFMWDCSEL